MKILNPSFSTAYEIDGNFENIALLYINFFENMKMV